MIHSALSKREELVQATADLDDVTHDVNVAQVRDYVITYILNPEHSLNLATTLTTALGGNEKRYGDFILAVPIIESAITRVIVSWITGNIFSFGATSDLTLIFKFAIWNYDY